MTAKIGLPVVVKGITSNGHDGQPGLISVVWSHGATAGAPQSNAMVNVSVLPDCGAPVARTSIPFYEEFSRAEQDGVLVYAYKA